MDHMRCSEWSTFGFQNLLKPQSFKWEEEVSAIKNSMTVDYFFGNIEELEIFAERIKDIYPDFVQHLEVLKSLNNSELKESFEYARKKCLLMTMLFLTGECNADCEICYTARVKKVGELTWEEMKEIIEQTRKMGSKTVYVAGEGEPTLDDSFWKLVNYTQNQCLMFLFFTNGLVFSNEKEAERVWGTTAEKLVERIVESGSYFYFKLWSTNPKLVREMMRLGKDNDYQWVEYWTNGRKILIPLGLYLFLTNPKMSRERIGIETVVEKRNAEEIRDVILPFILEEGLKSYIEPIIHAGRYFGSINYDPTPKQLAPLAPYMVRGNCIRVAYKLAILNNGYATPAIAVPLNLLVHLGTPEELNCRGKTGIKDIFELRHRSKILTKYRYEILGCLCEKLNLELASKLHANTSAKARHIFLAQQ